MEFAMFKSILFSLALVLGLQLYPLQADAIVLRVQRVDYTLIVSPDRLVYSPISSGKVKSCDFTNASDGIDKDNLPYTVFFYYCGANKQAMFKIYTTINLDRFMIFDNNGKTFIDDAFSKDGVETLSN